MKSFRDITEGRNDVVKALADKAKTGGIDKADFKKAHDLYKSAKLQDLKKLIKGLDTDVAEYIADLISRNDSKVFNSMYPKAKAGDYMAQIIREEAELEENVQDEKRMMKGQLMFIAYAAREISAYIDRVNDPEEWYQNKMATTHSMMKTLYSYAQGQMQAMNADDDLMAGYYGEETKLDARRREFKEKLRKLAYEKYGKKKVDEVDEAMSLRDIKKKKERDEKKKKDGTSDSQYQRMKKKQYGGMMGGLKDDLDEAQPIEEANFKPGNLKLKDGKTVKISMDDAKAITAVMKTLSSKNRKEMETRLMADKKGFDEIMAFVQAASE